MSITRIKPTKEIILRLFNILIVSMLLIALSFVFKAIWLSPTSFQTFFAVLTSAATVVIAFYMNRTKSLYVDIDESQLWQALKPLKNFILSTLVMLLFLLLSLAIGFRDIY